MKFTVSWLKKHLATSASLEEICTTLTALGLEVERVEDRGAVLAPFIIARVLTAEKHPQADRLKVATVDTGNDVIQVVCGAPNCRAGINVVLARPGDVMPDSGEALKKGVIRGVESQGMLCASDELMIGDDHAGIIEIPDGPSLGSSFATYAGYDDPVIEINLTPNRPDCAGVMGIARDLAAAGLGTLISSVPEKVQGTFKSPFKVKLDFPGGAEACPLFAGRLIRNIKNGASPEWLQQALRAIGLRPISAFVDITNFLTVDRARPLHVFDANKISGTLVAKAATGGETFAALNGKTYTLDRGMTVISDDNGVLGLGGIMGGESSACDEATKDVFLESAFFDPTRTAQTGRALQIVSDARYRFERGIDPAFTVPGLELATALVIALCGSPATEVSEIEIAGAEPKSRDALALSYGTCAKLIGVDVEAEEQQEILTKLGFSVTASKDGLTAVPPSWRPDIDGPADLVEEIIRVKGYDTIIPKTLPATDAVTSVAIDLMDIRSSAIRRALAAQGLMEAVTWSFMPSALAEVFGTIDPSLRLTNPISSDLDVMRPSALPNLITAAKRNTDRGFGDVQLFEVGAVFKNATPEGQLTVATVLRSGATPRHWATPSRAVDVFDVKADVLAALSAAGAPVASLQVTADAPDWYHPGRSGCLRLGPALIATFGEIHPTLLKLCDAGQGMVGAEIFVSALPQSRTSGFARPLLKIEALQPVLRDFAFVVDKAVTAAKLVRAAKDADKALIRDVTVFDVYEGRGVDPGKKSVALSVTVQPNDKTLTDVELDALASKVTASVAKATGAVLRG